MVDLSGDMKKSAKVIPLFGSNSETPMENQSILDNIHNTLLDIYEELEDHLNLDSPQGMS